MKQRSKLKYYINKSSKFGWGINSQIPEYKIKEFLTYIKGKSVLDIGCGPGHLVNTLSLQGFQATGLDMVPKFIDFANQTQTGTFVLGNAAKLPFKDKQFDTVILKSILEHTKDDQKVLSESLRVSKQIVIVAVPHRTNPNLKKRGLIFSHYQDHSHLRNYSEKSLERLIKNSGGKVISISPTEKIPNKSLIFELIKGPFLLKRILIKLIFLFFKEKQYYLELLAIIKPC